MSKTIASVQRLALVALLAAFVLSVSTSAHATATKLTLNFNAAAYEVGATGTFPSLQVGAKSSNVTGAGPFTLPDVSPGHPVTLVVAVTDANTGAPISIGQISISDGTNKLYTATIAPITYIAPSPISRLGVKASGYGIKYTTRLPKGVHALSMQYLEPNGTIGSTMLSTQVTSIPHTALDLACQCYAGTTALTCIQSNQPKTPAGESLVCKSHVVAETFDASRTTPYWSVPPAGNVSVNFPGMGIGSALLSNPGTTSAIATITFVVPSQIGTYTLTPSFNATTGIDGLASTGPSTTVSVVAPP